MKYQFYGLLYISEHSAAVNMRSRVNADIINTYLYNAIGLHRSLARFGYGLTLLTNSTSLIQERLKKIAMSNGLLPNFVELQFQLNVPLGVGFPTAHHKIGVLDYLSRCEGRSCLVDLDVICLADPSFLFLDNRTWVYKINHQVYPAYGEKIIVRDLEKVSGQKGFRDWYGGEFLCADRDVFQRLYIECMEIWPRYVDSAPTLHHNGDEMVISAALCRLSSQDLKIQDAGVSWGVYRYWTGSIKHKQHFILSVLSRTHFLHLPQGKALLERITRSNIFELKKIRKAILLESILALPRRYIGNLKRLIR